MNMTYQGDDKVDNSCTATSVYLSFDEETSPIYKTLTSISDNSMIDVDLDANRESENENYHQESTLEADEALPMLSMLETVKENSPPLKPITTATTTNILQDFNTLLSSTPAKENLNTNYELPHGLNNNIQVDLHLAFANIDADDGNQSKNFETNSATLLSHLIGENKENISPEGKKAGNLSNSSSSSNTITPLKEQQIQPEEYLSDKSNTISSPQDNGRTLTKNSVQKKASYKFSDLQTITSLIEQHTNESQPNLPAVSSKSTEIGKAMSSEAEIPQLMDKILQISSKSITKDKRSIISSTIATSTTTTVAEKRPLNPTRRRSAILRTTLNTSSNKMTRKSMAVSTISQSRRSMIPQNVNIKVNKVKMSQKNSVFDRNKTSHLIEQNEKKITLLNKNNKSADIKAVKTANIDKFRKSINPNLATARFIKPETTYICVICKAKFRIKSLLDAHKLSHDFDMPEQNHPAKRRNDNSNISSNTNTNTNSNPNIMPNSMAAITLSVGPQCKYCDKKFALQRTLHIHLLENCQKIPPSDKRKLQFTENKHVVKAPLPNVFNSQQNNNSSSSSSRSGSNSSNAFFLEKKSNTKVVSTRPKDLGKTLQQINSMGHLTKPSSGLAQIKAICKSLENSQMNEMVNNCESLPPPSAPVAPTTGLPKIKRTIAHSGVYCTPTKTIPCHLCKLSFKTILDFTNHNLMCHMRTTTCQP